MDEKNEIIYLVVLISILLILANLLIGKAINDKNKTYKLQNYYIDQNENIYHAENIFKSKNGQYFYRSNYENIFNLFTDKQIQLDIMSFTAFYDTNGREYTIESIFVQNGNCYLKYNNNCILEIKAISQSLYNFKRIVSIVFIICCTLVCITFAIKVGYSLINKL